MIDSRVISLFQRIVDQSERQPAWWVEQTAWAYVAAAIVATIHTNDGIWQVIGVAGALALATALIWSSKKPSLLAASASAVKPFRLGFLVLIGCNAVSLILHTNSGRAAQLLSSVLLTACYYFAACNPPRPRRRRQTAAQPDLA